MPPGRDGAVFTWRCTTRKDARSGEDIGLQTVSGKPVPVEYTFRVRKMYGAKIPYKMSMSIFVEKNSDVSVSNLKMSLNNHPGESHAYSENPHGLGGRDVCDADETGTDGKEHSHHVSG